MTKRLNFKKTLENLKKWREQRDEEALTSLVLGNQRLVKHFALKYGNEVISCEDLESICNEALIRAIHQFDYINKSIQCFPSYITTAMEHQISVEFKKSNKHSHVISLNHPVYQDKDGNTINIGSIIGSDFEKDSDREIKAIVIGEILQDLSEKERQIIYLRYGFDCSQKRSLGDVGAILGCTRQAVSQKEQKILKKLRSPENIQKLNGLLD